MSADPAPALVLRGISKRFGRVHALSGADLVVRAGTVHALVGENGAGKSTLMRIAFGMLEPDRGVIERDGHPLRFRSPSDAIAAGIGMVHQHFSLVPAMTVAENISLGGRGVYDAASANARVETAVAASGLSVDATARVADLSVPMQQRVEILKAFAHGATLLILDEPTAVLAPKEAAALLARLRDYARAGKSVVLITHKLREALDIADDVSVLRSGATVFTTPVASATASRLVQEMTGSRPPAPVSTQRTERSDIVLQLENVTVNVAGVQRLAGASVTVHGGEIVGVAGVDGSGERELLRVLAGRLSATSGRVTHPELVGFVPEDRHRDALVGEFTLTENFAVANAGRRRGQMPWDALRTDTRAILQDFDVRALDADALAATLSGGNQQRFVLGRELRASPRAIVAENPSRGLDVRATATVHHELRAARGRGTAVVVYTSDLDELLELADRVFVCFAGRVQEVPRSADAISRAMVGADG